VTFTAEEKTTYPQNWTAYNQAQTGEQDKFLALLADLCSGLPVLPSIYPPVFAIWKWNFEVKPKLKQQGPKPLEPNLQEPVHV